MPDHRRRLLPPSVGRSRTYVNLLQHGHRRGVLLKVQVPQVWQLLEVGHDQALDVGQGVQVALHALVHVRAEVGHVRQLLLEKVAHVGELGELLGDRRRQGELGEVVDAVEDGLAGIHALLEKRVQVVLPLVLQAREVLGQRLARLGRLENHGADLFRAPADLCRRQGVDKWGQG